MENCSRGIEFESTCRQTLQRLGFERIQVTKRSNDQGADLTAYLGATKYVFQCKNEKRKQGNRPVQEAIAAKAFYAAERCAVISETEFLRSAYALARPNYCLLLTLRALSSAAEQGKAFQDLIQNYEFPDIPFVERDQDLVRRYEELKHKLRHTPRNFDFDPTTRHLIAHKYGGVTNLAKQLGDAPYSRRPSDDEIRKEYRRVRGLLCRVPTLREIAANSNLSRNCFKEYPFTKLQRECGDRPNYERGVSKEALVKAFSKLNDELGRVPTLRDLDERGEYRSSYYRARWGKMDSFLRELGIPQGRFKRRTYDKDELVLMYLLLERVLGIREGDRSLQLNHTILNHLKYRGKVFVSASAFSRRFGTWKRFIDYIGGDSASRVKAWLDRAASACGGKQPNPGEADSPPADAGAA